MFPPPSISHWAEHLTEGRCEKTDLLRMDQCPGGLLLEHDEAENITEDAEAISAIQILGN